MLRPILLFLLFAFTTAHADGPACSRSFALALHEHGQLYSVATDSGIDKDFADELIRRSGCKISVVLMPRARIWQLIESGALDFSLSGISNDDREKFADFAWYSVNKYYLLTRKDARIARPEDFQAKPDLKLGVIRGFRYNPSANRIVDELRESNRVYQAGTLDPLYESLSLNKIQGMIIEPFDYPAVNAKEFRELTTIVEFNDRAIPHGLIMSKRALSTSEREKWRALVDTMRADGTVRHILEKHLGAGLAATMTHF
jgi:polar amino acid transport system substrate-binding protein